MSVNGNGNVAALCEALELCKHELCEMCRRHNPGETCVNGCETIIRAKTALAANQPIYGQHPQSAPVGDAAAMREAALPWIAFAEWLLENAGKDALGAAIRDNGPIIRQRLEELRAALSAPPRNCDVGTARQQEKRHKEEVCLKSACPKHEGFVSKACKGCFAMWAQMPYEEGGAK